VSVDVPVYGRGGIIIAHAKVDDRDAALVLGRRWNLDHDGYVCCHDRKDGRDTTAKMHRLIMQASPGMDVDHIDLDRLNNRRGNLRVCTHAQNMLNHPGLGARSGFRGVRRMPGGRYHARISHRYHEIHLGAFDTAEEASAARRAAEIRLRGEFAPVNP
jgi:hypothetical protein